MRVSEIQEEAALSEPAVDIGVCIGTNCYIKGSWKLLEGLSAELRRRGLSEQCRVKARFCTGSCEGGPNVVIGNKIISVEDVNSAGALIDAHLMPHLSTQKAGK